MLWWRAAPDSLLLYGAGILGTDSFTGVAAVTFILMDGLNLAVHLLIYVSRTGIHALAAVGAFVPVYRNLPHSDITLSFIV